MKQRKLGLIARIFYSIWAFFMILIIPEGQEYIESWAYFSLAGLFLIFGIFALISLILESDLFRKLFVHGKGGSGVDARNGI